MSNRLVKVSEVKILPGMEVVLRTTSSNETTGIGTKGIDLMIDWGDGSTLEHSTTDNPSHEYTTAGDYIVKVYGTITEFDGDRYEYVNSLIQVNRLDCPKLGLTTLSGVFSGRRNLTSVNNIKTNNVTNMHYMFYDCLSLTELDLTNFDTSNVTNMSLMFNYCTSLTELDVSNFDTSNVISMANMFENCTSLTELDLTNFDTSNLTNMNYIFKGCTSLVSLDLSGWNASNVLTMDGMFSNCSSLTSLDLSGFYTSNLAQTVSMFSNCSSLTELDLTNFDTSNVGYMDEMFGGCGDNLCITATNNFTTTQLPSRTHMFHDSDIIHPTSTEQTDLTDANGGTYNYSCS